MKKEKTREDTASKEIYDSLWKAILHEEMDKVLDENRKKIITRTQDRVRDEIKTKLS